jgi:hypothetical protein
MSLPRAPIHRSPRLHRATWINKGHRYKSNGDCIWNYECSVCGKTIKETQKAKVNNKK